ncbi:MAG: S8 family serine peptidase [Gemmataceae bacterium]
MKDLRAWIAALVSHKSRTSAQRRPTLLGLERLEAREQPSVTPVQVTDIQDARGNSIEGQLTRVARPVIVGTGREGQTIKVFDGIRLLGTVRVGASESWSFAVPRPLADGVHDFRAARMVDPRPALVQATYRLDTRAPQVTLSTSEFVRRDDKPTGQVNVVANDPFGLRSDVTLDIDLNRDGKFSGHELNYLISPTPAFALPILNRGTYTIRARVADLAGNIGKATAKIIYDPDAGFVGSSVLLSLAGLQPRDQVAGPIAALTEKQKSALVIDQNRVLVDVRGTMGKHLAAFRAELEALGFVTTQTTASSNLLTGYLPIDRIDDLPGLHYFSAAVPVYKPITRVGSVTTEGDAVIKANTFRASQQVNGAGIKVGVISDSVDQVGGGLADSIRTGDLPRGVQVLQDGSSSDTDEGRAMLEIVHDVAPGAPLAFHTGSGGPAVFAAGIRNLANAGARVIVDDLGYTNSPKFTAGRMGMAVDDVTRRGVFYATAAGNDGSFAWRSGWSPINTTIDGIAGTYLRFGNSAYHRFTLADNESIGLSFGWDATYLEGGDPRARFQVPNNIDVYIVRTDNNTIVAQFDTNNRNTDEAFEYIDWTNDQSVTSFALVYRLVSGPAPQRLAWVSVGSSVNTIRAQGEGAPAVYGQVLASGALATAAADSLRPTVVETYSSQGGAVEIFADDQGNRYSQAQRRLKPEVTAPDNVVTSFFGQQVNNRFRFSGTSAAAPHVAAAAALLFQQQPLANNFVVANHLQQTTRDLVRPGFDARSGFGLIQLTPITSQGIPGGFNPNTNDQNETSDRAAYQGAIGRGSNYLFGLAVTRSVTGFPDYDWYNFTAQRAGLASVTVISSSVQPLWFSLYRRVGDALVLIGRTTVAPGKNAVLAGAIKPGELFYVDVHGINIAPGLLSQGAYTLDFRLS